MQTIKLTVQQSVRIGALPDSDQVVGFDRDAPLVRRSTGEMLRIQRDGRLTAATATAKRDFNGQVNGAGRLGGVQATTPYTQVMD